VIIASLLLIVAAAGLLGLGLWQSSIGLLTGSIAASLLAAVVLVVGARRAAGARPPARHAVVDQTPDRLPPAQAPTTEATTMTIPAQGPPDQRPPDRGGAETTAEEVEPDLEQDGEPPDEPAPQQVSAEDVARVGRMLTEVLVVDGRPRYHLPGCVHLLGRDSEPLPVGEAIELGFTPCSLCEPDSALLADARRV
jgi:hypothetical protein